MTQLSPPTIEEFAAQVAQYNRDGQKIAILGAGTLAGMGLPATRQHQVTLSTAALTEIISDAPSDLVICAQTGITLRKLSVVLAKHGTFVPFDAPRANLATLGGTLAAGWLGPRRHLYGRVRDYLVGTTAILADGVIAHAGGIVVKNVAGYDLSRLYVGSFGTLAVLAQANLKTRPLPETSRLFLAPLPEGSSARALDVLHTLAVTPAAALWICGFHSDIDGEDGSEGRVLIRLDGSAAILERATRDLRSALGRAGVPETRVLNGGAQEVFERAIDAYIATLGERSITYRIAAASADAQSRLLELRRLATTFELRVDSIVDGFNGDIVLRISDLDARALAAKMTIFDDALHDIEPHARVIATDHPNRRGLNLWGAPPPGIERMRALKAEFDPNGTLNYGRFIGGI